MSEVKGFAGATGGSWSACAPRFSHYQQQPIGSFVEANGLQEQIPGSCLADYVEQPATLGSSIKQDSFKLFEQSAMLRRLPRQFGGLIPNLEKRMARAARRARRL